MNSRAQNERNSIESSQSNNILAFQIYPTEMHIMLLSDMENRIDKGIKNNDVIIELLAQFFELKNIKDGSEICFERYYNARKLLRDPILLLDSKFMINFLENCPFIWKNRLEIELRKHLYYGENFFNLLRYFMEQMHYDLISSPIYALFRNKIINILCGISD